MHILRICGQVLFTGRSVQNKKKLENTALSFEQDKKILPTLKFLSTWLISSQIEAHFISLWQLGYNRIVAKERALLSSTKIGRCSDIPEALALILHIQA